MNNTPEADLIRKIRLERDRLWLESIFSTNMIDILALQKVLEYFNLHRSD